MIIIPLDSLDKGTLRRLVSEFVTRDGTDYGQMETPLEQRIEQVMNALVEGHAVITWDERLHSATIRATQDLPKS